MLVEALLILEQQNLVLLILQLEIINVYGIWSPRA